MKLKRIDIFEDIDYAKLEDNVNSFIEDNEYNCEVDFKITVFRDEENLDVVTYTAFIKSYENV